MTPPLQLFLAYAHTDESHRQALEKHLAILMRTGPIDAFSDRHLTPGDVIEMALGDRLKCAQVILLLVSADFLASNFCCREMTQALQRRRAGAAHVLPVIARPCDWQHAPFGHLLVAPRDGKPVTTWRSRDAAWLDVVRSIRSLHHRCETSHPALCDGVAGPLARQ